VCASFAANITQIKKIQAREGVEIIEGKWKMKISAQRC
jgi:hypothetical protein